MMKNDFRDKADFFVGNILLANGFRFEEAAEIDGGHTSVVIYRSPSSRICLYRSERGRDKLYVGLL